MRCCSHKTAIKCPVQSLAHAMAATSCWASASRFITSQRASVVLLTHRVLLDRTHHEGVSSVHAVDQLLDLCALLGVRCKVIASVLCLSRLLRSHGSPVRLSVRSFQQGRFPVDLILEEVGPLLESDPCVSVSVNSANSCKDLRVDQICAKGSEEILEVRSMDE